MNISRISAIFEKDIKDFMKNTMLVFMPILPILLAFMYSRIGKGEEEGMPVFVVYMVIGTCFAAVTFGCLVIMMAEENEKKTWRGLVLSPATMLDVIVGKSLVTTMLTTFSVIFSLIAMESGQFLAFQPIIGLIAGLFFFALLGIAVGLIAKTVATTQVYFLPVLFLFGMTPMVTFFGLAKDSIVLKVFNTFPLMQLIKMEETGHWKHLFIMLIWVFGAAVFTYISFKRSAKDD